MVQASRGFGGRVVALIVAVVMAGVVCGGEADEARAVGRVLVEYGASYERDGGSVLHRGVDIAAVVGEAVEVFAAGEVTFAGSVPAGPGETMLAVTVRDAEGRLWSYLPLDRLDVVAGGDVGRGGVVGSVAAAGDGSSALPHLHVGLRETGAYIDPRPLLALDGPATADSVTADATHEPSPVTRGDSSPVSPAPTLESVPALGGEPSAAGAPSAVAADGEVASSESFAPRTLTTAQRPIARLLSFDEVEARRRSLTSATASDPVHVDTVLPWLVPASVLGAAAAIAVPCRSIRRRRLRSKVCPDPRPTRLQPR